MRPITFKQYIPLLDEKDWEIGTEDKGTRYAIKRRDTGGLVCALPFGLRSEEKALARMLVAVPEMVLAIKLAKALLEDPDADASDADAVLAVIDTVLEMAS